MDEKDKKEYEISVLLKGEGGKETFLSRIKSVGGEIVNEGPFSHLTLAYPIEAHKEAVFGYVHIRLEPAVAKSLEKELQSEQEFLRVLIVTPPTLQRESRGPIPSSKPREFSPKVLQEPKVISPLTNEDLEKKIEEILK